MKEFWSLKGYWHQALIVFLLVSGGAFCSRGYWRWDDPQIVYFAYKYAPWEYFFNPEVHRIFSSVNFTPWVIFSFELDQLIALSPSVSYLHHSLALGLLAVLYLRVIRFWLPPYWGLFCILLLATGLPFVMSTMQLMVRHYIEGMVFCLLAIILYMGWIKGNRYPVVQLLASAAFYMLSMLSKEVYAPLPLVLFFMPETNWRKKFLAAVIYAAVGAIYISWRFYMVGAPAPVWAGALDVSPALVASQLLTAPVVLYGAWGAWLLLATMLGYLLFERKALSWQHVACFSAILLVVILPIIPLAVTLGFEIHLRYLFVLHAAVCFLICLFLSRLSRLSLGAPLALIFGLAFLAAAVGSTFKRLQPFINTAKAFDVQSQFLWSEENNSAIIPDIDYRLSYYHYAFLTDLKLELTGRKSPPIIAGPVFSERYINGRRFFTYNKDCQCMREFDYKPGTNYLQNAPLEANASKQSDHLSWDLKISPQDKSKEDPSPLPEWAIYNYCGILLDNGVTTGFLMVGCKGGVYYNMSIRGHELLSSDLVFMLEEKGGAQHFSKLYEGVK